MFIETIEHSKFIVASLLSIPLSMCSSKKWGEIYERTLAHIRALCRARLQATPGKASSAISELVEIVRSHLDNFTVTGTRILIAIARSVNPIDGY